MDRPIKIVTVVQTRCGSNRFPKKVLKPLLGKPLFVRLIERVKAAKRIGEVIVATTYLEEDDVIERICSEEGLNCFRGHPTDLLDRHYQAVLPHQPDAVAKIPSDCPLIDPKIIDRVFDFYIAHHEQFDYVSNLHPPTYPDGNDVEVMSISSLRTAWREAKKDYEREHTTPYLWDQPHHFRIGNISWEKGLDYSKSHRWTLDYEEDYLLIRTIFEELYPRHPIFTMEEILELMVQRPEIRLLNQKYLGVTWYRQHLADLKTLRSEQGMAG